MNVTTLPVGTSAIITEDHKDHGNHGEHRDRGHCDGASTKDALNAGFTSSKDAINAGFSSSKDALYAGFSNTKDAVAIVDKAVEVNSLLGVTATKDSRYDIFNELSKGFTAAALAGNHTNEIIDNEVDALSESVNALKASNSVSFCQAQGLQYQLASQSILDAAKNKEALSVAGLVNTNQLAVQAEKNSAALNVAGLVNTNQLAVQAVSNFNAIQLEQVKNAAAVQLEAVKNASASVLLQTTIAAAQAAAAAECCCETKSLIKDEADKTRDLICGNRMQELQARVVSLETAKMISDSIAAAFRCHPSHSNHS